MQLTYGLPSAQSFFEMLIEGLNHAGLAFNFSNGAQTYMVLSAGPVNLEFYGEGLGVDDSGDIVGIVQNIYISDAVTWQYFSELYNPDNRSENLGKPEYQWTTLTELQDIANTSAAMDERVALMKALYPGPTTITGTAAIDVLFGFNGKDKIMGLGESDTIHGCDGNDRLRGGGGDDFIFGDKGKDKLWGNAGRDALDGGKGRDELYGGGKRDLLSGGDGGDILNGGAGNDRLFGGEGADILLGGIGKNVMKGGGGDDNLFAQWGTNKLSGGAGIDTFYFTRKNTDNSEQTIIDFNSISDVIRIDEFDLDAISVSRENGHTYVDVDNVGVDTGFLTIILKNTTLAVGEISFFEII